MKRSESIAPSRRAGRRGIALVITLLMLSVVTITAVAFLAVSRRERAAVGTAAEQIDARYVADIGIQHALGRVSGRIAATTNRLAYGGYFVSTNYLNPLFRRGPDVSFLNSPDYRRLTNVTYFKTTNGVIFDLSRVTDRDEYARYLGNLYYDPRPPVFVQTNRNPALPQDFRFYLDLNRNGQFETNGPVTERDRQGRQVSNDLRFYWGDPEWIGVLEHPDMPHSGTNRFTGRFAYVVVPTSQTLDLNYLGNNAKQVDLDQGLPPNAGVLLNSGFLRNQGVGTWEMNLAGFFGALNTNVWSFSVNDYFYRTNLAPNSGLAFSDAERLRRFRQQNFRPLSADLFYETESGSSALAQVRNTFERDFVDDYSDGPLVVTLSDIRSRFENDNPQLSWSGSDLTNQFTELNDLFNPQLGLAARITGQFTNQNVARTSPLSTYDRYTFYRLISQLGTDTSDGRFESGVHPAYADAYRGRSAVNPFGFYRRPKLNLNYAIENPDSPLPEAARVSTFRPWGALEWFTNATHRMLLAEFTNGLPFIPPLADRSVPGLGIAGPAIARDFNGVEYLTNHVYDAQVHRVLQVAANIYDATTNAFLNPASQRIAAPTVLRPLVYEDARSPGVLRIHGFEEVLNGSPNFLLARGWTSPDLVTNRAPRLVGSPAQTLIPSLPEQNPPMTSREAGFNVFGLPWVVGAKKGLPNFNQAMWQTIIQPTRRLIITRPSRTSKIQETELPFAGANNGGFRTEYQYIFNVTNIVGVEAWNSYLTNFPRPVRIFATNVLEFTLMDETPGGAAVPVLQRRELLSTNYLKGASWAAREYEARGFVRNTASPAYLEFPNNITNTAVNVAGGIAIGTGFIYDPVNRRAFSLNQTNQGRVVISQSNRRFLTPILSAYVTNSLMYAITDEDSGRLLDIVTLRSSMVRTNIISTLGLSADGLEQEFFNEQAGATGNSGASMPAFWSTNIVQNNRTRGMDNQMLVSIGDIRVPLTLWRNPLGNVVSEDQRQSSIDGLLYFLYGILPANDTQAANNIRNQYGSNLVVQVGFNPSPRVFLVDRRMANDPLVHYTRDDLTPGYFFLTEAEYTEVPGVRTRVRLATNSVGLDLGSRAKFINAYAPWGTNGNLTGAQAQAGGTGSTAYDYSFKDPLIRSSDDWTFPIGTNASFRFAGIGQLGRIHRGTPWQTFYLKSLPAFENGQPPLENRLLASQMTWSGWAGNIATHPTNDWKYVDLFTTAINDNAARGQLGVGQAGTPAFTTLAVNGDRGVDPTYLAELKRASWAAVLSGVPLLENTSPGNADNPQPLFLRPDSPEIVQMLAGYQRAGGPVVQGLVQAYGWTNAAGQLVNPDGAFTTLGSILQVPTFSDRAPFINSQVNWATARNISDEVLERVPQQILSLLRTDEPRFVIYSFGQTLKPAQNAINLRPGPLYGIVTNYAITGEYVTKTVLRLDGDPRRLQPVIEDQRVILSNP